MCLGGLEPQPRQVLKPVDGAGRGGDGGRSGAPGFATQIPTGGEGGGGSTTDGSGGQVPAGGDSGSNAVDGLSNYGRGGNGAGVSAAGGGGGGYTRATVRVGIGESVNYFVAGGGAGSVGASGQQGAIRITYQIDTATEIAVNFQASGFGSSVPVIVKPTGDVTLPDGVTREESRDITLAAANYGGLTDDGTYLYALENRSTNPILRAFQLSDGARAATADKDLTTLAGLTIEGVAMRANEIYLSLIHI